ncbi:MAG TPA: DEAD/DEAH box helicase [Candidatus Binatia bacterium]|nr:DEAD/DEAH box helicase [Candidatus Binatia bacterium]
MGYVTEQLSDAVRGLTKQRGRSYFLSGAVRLIEGDASHVSATVQGSRRYEVEISIGEPFLDFSCTCPFYERDFETCKHIWATALAAEARGYLRNALQLAAPALFGREKKLFPEKTQPTKKSPVPNWKQHLDALRVAMQSAEAGQGRRPPSEREMVYMIDLDDTVETEKLVIEVARRERRMDGSWGKLKSSKLYSYEISSFHDAADRRILAILLGGNQDMSYGYASYGYGSIPAQLILPATLWEVLLPLMCGTGRCFLRQSMTINDRAPLRWDNREPWQLCLAIAPGADGEQYRVNAALRRGAIEVDLAKPDLLLAGGLVFYDGQIARLEDYGAFGWVSLLQTRGPLSFPKEEREIFLEELFRFPRQPRLALPDELKFEVVSQSPRPRMALKPMRTVWSGMRFVAHLSFDYDGQIIPDDHPGPAIYQKDQRRLVTRDAASEISAKKRLKQLGFRKGWESNASEFELSPDLVPKVVRALTNEGWHVEAEGSVYRAAGTLNMEISSGVDWFEVRGGAQFGDAKVSLPALLRALKQADPTVRLDDGTWGIVPEEWMKKYGLLADLGRMEGNHLRFTRPQAGLLDVLLASEPAVTADAVFERVRKELHDFAGVRPADPPAGFSGALRAYQREGLGWLYFLQRFGFGGCLADDMGLGKTIQVLALLESRRELAKKGAKKSGRASLVVVPRSLVFHWQREAARFAPKLKILDHTGGARLKPGDHFEEYDVVITTYGTLRRDALQFRDVRFDYCILDEAQAIKNAGTLSAKAARLLGADHRLALSGTPVENHLGELWSLFEFLNPGMLGSAAVFGRAGRNPDTNTRTVLARALRPFILRRTKGEVARELPPKTEQTIYCDLKPPERKLYDELRDYYRTRLLKHAERERLGRLKFQVLEALLRLRQAACHLGLIDKKKAAEPSAKVDTLLAQLDQVLDEGHKILVFSQFTSLLAIVRSRLDGANIPYAYLDGRTRDREAPVEQFQNDPNLKLFLISLKAGGLGLNLHAAEYVYLLDPWWNPAVETQAIDRAHRIGQTRQVFAYRVIARDTVEEKVLALQQTKRDLADAIITADNSLIHNLTREDLELLLS